MMPAYQRITLPWPEGALSMLTAWWQAWRASRRQAQLQAILQRRAIDESLWQSTVAALPFVASLPPPDLQHLRHLASLFLDDKEFSGAHGLQVSDAQAVMVATQACLPILHIAPRDRPDLALAWYGSFVGIVLHAAQVRARREWIDDDGVAHSGSEELTGEMLEGGPLMLAWSDVQAAGQVARTEQGAYNVVIHEFIHVMDLQDGLCDGCPPLPAAQRHQWRAVLQAQYDAFCEASESWVRFGGMQGAQQPLLDPYGSTSLDEFFPVAAEAYFTQRERFSREYPALHAQFDAFFRPHDSSDERR
jgi:MtfA peptidase